VNFTLRFQAVLAAPLGKRPLRISRVGDRRRSYGILGFRWRLANGFPHLRQWQRERDGALPDFVSGRWLLVAVEPLPFDLPAGFENKGIGADDRQSPREERQRGRDREH